MGNYIFLGGFMGCGKSSLGKKLAGELNFRFVDCDERLEDKSGMKVGEIFNKKGEVAFREMERECLRDIIKDQKNTVVALGGGGMCSEENLKLIKENGFVIYIRVPAVELSQRLEKDKQARPLLNGLKEEALTEHINELLAGREKYYLRADAVTEGINLSHHDLLQALPEKFW